MIHHQINIEARSNPETLERILRVVRHRGFQMCSMRAKAANNVLSIDIKFIVLGSRPVDLLFEQLNKLEDVERVSICQNTLITSREKLYESGRQ